MPDIDCPDIANVEITPEMEWAGDRALRARWVDLLEPNGGLFPLVVREIFLAMERVRRLSSP